MDSVVDGYYCDPLYHLLFLPWKPFMGIGLSSAMFVVSARSSMFNIHFIIIIVIIIIIIIINITGLRLHADSTQ